MKAKQVLTALWHLVEELFMVTKPSDWIKYILLFVGIGLYVLLGG